MTELVYCLAGCGLGLVIVAAVGWLARKAKRTVDEEDKRMRAVQTGKAGDYVVPYRPREPEALDEQHYEYHDAGIEVDPSVIVAPLVIGLAAPIILGVVAAEVACEVLDGCGDYEDDRE